MGLSVEKKMFFFLLVVHTSHRDSCIETQIKKDKKNKRKIRIFGSVMTNVILKCYFMDVLNEIIYHSLGHLGMICIFMMSVKYF